jgi:hypothetical protein
MSTPPNTPDLTIPAGAPAPDPNTVTPDPNAPATASATAVSEKEIKTVLSKDELDSFAEAIAAANGEIPEAILKTITERGLPADVVKGYVEGRVAVERLQYADLINDIGGDAEFAKIRGWAAVNLKPEDRERINGYVKARDYGALKNVYRALKTQFVGAVGTDPARVVSGSPASAGPVAFASQAEFQRALRDPRYTNDPAYQRQILERLRVSNI